MQILNFLPRPHPLFLTPLSYPLVLYLHASQKQARCLVSTKPGRMLCGWGFYFSSYWIELLHVWVIARVTKLFTTPPSPSDGSLPWQALKKFLWSLTTHSYRPKDTCGSCSGLELECTPICVFNHSTNVIPSQCELVDCCSLPLATMANCIMFASQTFQV